jgi:ATP-dependent Clp protease ATP-binding subunit ClpC
MATRMCDVCGIRPAVVTVRRVVPGEGQRVEHLCEIHAAEAGVGEGRGRTGRARTRNL